MQELFESLRQFFTDIPGFLTAFVGNHGPWVYGLLFAIIFAETGLVLLPFLPGDSLLFTVGALSVPDKETGKAAFNVWIVSGVLIVAAIIGDAVNYHIGKYIGPRVFNKNPAPDHVPTFIERALNRQHLDRAHAFFEKYGGKAVILGRFVPIVRTFVPFVAGAGAMTYGKFVLYNVAGAFLWVGVCVGAGVLFGNIPFVKKNFELVIIGIIVVSVLPVVYEVLKARSEHRAVRSTSIS
ncbi:MAG: VTT domain-containing protein [Phycisphaerales bacterium]